MTYYEALGLEPRLSIDAADLKKHFYERSRQWHPDKFSRASAEEQQKALDMTALLNDALRALRDPYTRAEYYFQLQGIKLQKDISSTILEEFFDLNMTLQELKAGDESVRADVVKARDQNMKFVEEQEQQLTRMFAKYDSLDEATRNVERLEEPIADIINTRRYISNFLREVDKVLNVHVSD